MNDLESHKKDLLNERLNSVKAEILKLEYAMSAKRETRAVTIQISDALYMDDIEKIIAEAKKYRLRVYIKMETKEVRFHG